MTYFVFLLFDTFLFDNIHSPLNHGLMTNKHNKISNIKPNVKYIISLLSAEVLVLSILVMLPAKLIFLRVSAILSFEFVNVNDCSFIVS